MNREREEVINDVISSGRRLSATVCDERLYNCDVCFTCKLFNFPTNECYLTDEYMEKNAPRIYGNKERGYYDAKTIVKDPMWFRCKMWKELKLT